MTAATVTAPAATAIPAASDVLMILAANPGDGVAAVRATWAVNRATAARWIRDATTDPAHADTTTARTWAHYAAILDGRPVPGRRHVCPPITGTTIPTPDEHDLVTALIEHDDSRGAQR